MLSVFHHSIMYFLMCNPHPPPPPPLPPPPPPLLPLLHLLCSTCHLTQRVFFVNINGAMVIKSMVTVVTVFMGHSVNIHPMLLLPLLLLFVVQTAARGVALLGRRRRRIKMNSFYYIVCHIFQKVKKVMIQHGFVVVYVYCQVRMEIFFVVYGQ